MNKVCLFLSRHSREEVDHEALAEQVCMERASLCRFFKRASGRTMGEYVNEIWLSEAVRLLTGSDMSLLDIARCVGFQNYANFCRQFKRSKGFNARTIWQQFRALPSTCMTIFRMCPPEPDCVLRGNCGQTALGLNVWAIQ